MSNELTAAEQQFFATGELPQELVETPAASPAPEPALVPSAMPSASREEAPFEELKRQMEAEREHRARLEASLAQIARRLEVPAEPQKAVPVAPDMEADPLGALMYQLRTVTENVEKMQSTITQQQQQARQQAEFQQFQQGLQELRDTFTKTQPDFPQAYAHLRAQRALDLRDVGVSDANIQEALLRDEIAATQTAINQGKNPAKVLYEMAKRYGYTGKAGAPAGSPGVTAAKLEALRKGAEADVSLPKEGHESQLTFEGLKDASNSDLNKLVQDDRQWSRLVGNRGDGIF